MAASISLRNGSRDTRAFKRGTRLQDASKWWLRDPHSTARWIVRFGIVTPIQLEIVNTPRSESARVGQLVPLGPRVCQLAQPQKTRLSIIAAMSTIRRRFHTQPPQVLVPSSEYVPSCIRRWCM